MILTRPPIFRLIFADCAGKSLVSTAVPGY